MRRAHPRLRKTTKWAGLTASVILLAVWIASAWWGFGYSTKAGYHAAAIWGWASVGREYNPEELGASLFRLPRAELHWWPGWKRGFSGWVAAVPIWVLWLPGTVATAAAWRLDALARRRARMGCCAKCGYSLSGLTPGSPCPECGYARCPSAAAPR